MKSTLTLLALAVCGPCLAQDQILTRYNAKINAKVMGEGKASISYVKPELPGNNYVMDKADIAEIQYEDGRKATYPAELYEGLSLAETESRIVSLINSNAFSNEKDMDPLKAEFTGGKLVVSGKNFGEGTFDFKDVKSIPSISKKNNDLANLTTWLMGTDGLKSSKFAKRRLIMLVKGQDAAYELCNLMKHLNSLLKSQK